MLGYRHNPFSDLWKGEQKIIAEIASKVPDQGTIVEIGTFQGGTTQIFYEETHPRGIKTHTVDIAPQPKATELLKDLEVEIIIKPSVEAAQMWKESGNPPIDLLFIDGGHNFQNVFEDFNAWVGLIKPGGTVIFHDYDPIERGGIVHFGIQICIDAILKRQLLKNPKHQFKLFHGQVDSPDQAQLDIQDCQQTLVDLGKEIVSLRDADYADWTLVADDRFALLLNGCLKLEKCQGPILPKEALDPNQKYLVSAHPLGMPLDLLQAQSIPANNLTLIDSLKACYIVAQALETNFKYLHQNSAGRGELLKWGEALDMLEHGYGKSVFPENIEAHVQNLDAAQLSQLIAREQVKLNMLARIVKTFVDWTP